jgi:hypothetical protein
MTWTAALKEYSKLTGKFAVPKKGTPEYDAVIKIQNKLKGIPDPQEVKAEKIKKERKKKEEAVVVQPPPNPEEEKKKEEERRLALEQKAAEAALAAKEAKKAVRQATRVRLIKEREDAKKAAEDRAKLDGKLGLEAATMKKLGKSKRAMEDIQAEEEASKNVIKARYGARTTAIEDKTPKKQREPSFRIEDKQIIISFKE